VAKKRKPTSDALEILDRMMGNDKKLRAMAKQAFVDAEVGQLIYDARVKAALTQKQLAEMIGTTQSVIARLEDADYRGHSLTMLQRIAHALDRDLEISLKPRKRAA
jgi:ribosome-binding protein aMBF1 (putative translation factor)